MAVVSIKPCSRLMRGSPHQTDEQQEAHCLLQDPEEQHHKEEEGEEEEAEGEEREEEEEDEDEGDDGEEDNAADGAHTDEQSPSPANWKPLECEERLPTTVSDLPGRGDDLPTFIAHQGSLNPLKLHQKSACSADARLVASGWAPNGHAQSNLFPSYLSKHSRGQSGCPHVVLPHPEISRRTQKWGFLFADSRKQSAEQDHHKKQKSGYRKYTREKGSMHGLMANGPMSVKEEMGMEKRRNSSASLQDMVSFREALSNRERLHDRKSSSWEEEVRQAMARSLMGMKQGEEAVQGLQRSASSKEYHGISTLPPTLLVKKTRGSSKYDDTAHLEAGSKLDNVGSPRLQGKSSAEKGLWRGFSVKSPSEARWEEAAEVEEQQELQRRARSQSMRYDAIRSTEQIGNCGAWDACSAGDAAYHDDEWAVYKKSGYVNLRPHSHSTHGAPSCCSSLVGRSLSMRDTRMGLAMECASCGVALHGAGGPLLCFCSCCAAARASTSLRGGAATTVKKKGGIIQACRRLLGLGKKHRSNAQM